MSTGGHRCSDWSPRGRHCGNVGKHWLLTAIFVGVLFAVRWMQWRMQFLCSANGPPMRGVTRWACTHACCRCRSEERHNSRQGRTSRGARCRTQRRRFWPVAFGVTYTSARGVRTSWLRRCGFAVVWAPNGAGRMPRGHRHCFALRAERGTVEQSKTRGLQCQEEASGLFDMAAQALARIAPEHDGTSELHRVVCAAGTPDHG